MTDVKLPPAPPEPEGYVPYAEGGQTNADAYFDGYTACLATVKQLNNQPSIAASAEPLNLEHRRALREGERNGAEAEFFNARPKLGDTPYRVLFRAGFDRGYDAAPVAAQPAPTAQEPTCLLEAIGGLIGYEPDCAEGAAGMVPGGEYVTKSEVLRVIRSCAALTPAARDVLAERRRQVEVEGYTPEKDDEYADGMLANAATAYSTSAVMTMRGHTSFGAPPTPWPWLFKHWKPTTPRRDLVKAAALILAEIERIDRAANKENQS